MELGRYLLPLCLMAAACTANIQPEEPLESVSGEHMSFCASHETEPDSRTVLKDGRFVEWEKGDAIKVFDDRQKAWTLSEIAVDSSNPSKAVFSGLCNPASECYYAAYPASSAVSLWSGGGREQ